MRIRRATLLPTATGCRLVGGRQKRPYLHLGMAPFLGTAMRIHRRELIRLAAATAALPALSHLAMAQAYPARPARIIVGYAAGGGVDITAR